MSEKHWFLSVKDRFSAHDFAEVLRLLAEAKSKRDLGPEALLTMGRAILLSDEGVEYELEDALACFEKARSLLIDPRSPSLEVGWYHHMVEDDPATALPYFEEAVEFARVLLSDAARGLGQALLELGREEEARITLRALHTESLLPEELDEEVRELLD